MHHPKSIFPRWLDFIRLINYSDIEGYRGDMSAMNNLSGFDRWAKMKDC